MLSSSRDTDPQTITSAKTGAFTAKTFVDLGMDWDESQRRMKMPVWTFELYQNYIDQLLAEGKTYKSYVTEEELAGTWTPKRSSWKHLATSTNTLAWAKKKKQLTSQVPGKQQVWFNGSFGSGRSSIKMWYGQRRYRIWRQQYRWGLGASKEKWLPNLQLCCCDH